MCLKQMQQCVRNERSVFKTNAAECLKRTQCSPKPNTELHSDQEVFVTEQDNFNLKVYNFHGCIVYHGV